MDRTRRRVVVGLVSAAALVAVLTIGVVTEAGWVHALDSAVAEVISGWTTSWGWLVEACRVLGNVTEPFWSALVVLGVAAALASARFRAAAAFLVLSALFGVVAVSITKLAVARQRPPSAAQFDVHMDASFPSGHAAAGIYLYLATGLVMLRLGRANAWPWAIWIGRVLVVLGPLIGVSRLVLGVHWPSDVLAGWAFGTMALLGAALLLWEPLAAGWVRPPRVSEIEPAVDRS